MRKLRNRFGLLGLIPVIMISAGCLISGTFIIVESFSFTAQSGFYFYQVDITDDPDWEEHADKIDFIDVVGVEFYITSNESSNVIFNAYIDDYGVSGPDPTSIPSSATKVIDSLTVEPGSSIITYAQSLSIITGVDRLKELAKMGKFDFYGESTGNDGTTFIIDSAKVIVTFSASSS